jgi:hypothetical protein
MVSYISRHAAKCAVQTDRAQASGGGWELAADTQILGINIQARQQIFTCHHVMRSERPGCVGCGLSSKH